MKVVVFFFSGNGNTKWLVDEMTKLISQTDNEMRAISIEEIKEFDISDYVEDIRHADCIGFATPIYGSNLPPIMRNFISAIMRELHSYNDSAKYFFLNTVGYVNGFGVFSANKLMKPIGKKVVAYGNFRLFSSAPSKKSVLDISSDIYTKRLDFARSRLEKLVSSLFMKHKYINGIGPHLIVGMIIRNSLRDKIRDSYLTMSIDKVMCNECGICMKNCPTSSIVQENSELHFTSKCTSCMRCYNNCPMNAIGVAKFSKVNGYVQYKPIG